MTSDKVWEVIYKTDFDDNILHYYSLEEKTEAYRDARIHKGTVRKVKKEDE